MIIVTGGAGFIGSNLVESLNKRGYESIFIIDSLGKGSKWKNLNRLRFDDYLEKGPFLEKVLSGQVSRWNVEAIFHLGACSDTTQDDLPYLMENNYRYTLSLAEYALQAKVRFIYASSAATYGDGRLGFSDSPHFVPQLRPLNPYGFSKQLFDRYALRKGYFSHITGLKFFNVYGPGEGHKGEMRSFILKAFEQIRKEGRVRLFRSNHPDFNDGEQKRDFIYVREAVDKALFFLDNREACGLFNIGTGKARSWNDLVGAVFSALGMPAAIEYIPLPKALERQYQYFTQADTALFDSLGYKGPWFTLEQGITEYVNFLLEDSTL